MCQRENAFVVLTEPARLPATTRRICRSTCSGLYGLHSQMVPVYMVSERFLIMVRKGGGKELDVRTQSLDAHLHKNADVKEWGGGGGECEFTF